MLLIVVIQQKEIHIKKLLLFLMINAGFIFIVGHTALRKPFLSQSVLNSRRLSSAKGNHWTFLNWRIKSMYVRVWLNMATASLCLLLMTDWQGHRQARLYCHSIKPSSHQSWLLCHFDSHISFLAYITAKNQRLVYSNTVQCTGTLLLSFAVSG